MTKITLTDLANLQNETTAVNAINANNAILETAFDNTLSRDGTSPNTMESSLDMNSERILNLPQPLTNSEPLRLVDLNNFISGGTITNIPTGGTTGQLLSKKTSANYDVQWSDESSALVAGTNITITGTTPVTIATVASPTFTHITAEGRTSTGGTGTGNLVFGTSPTLITPVLGAATATTLNGITVTANTGTLTLGANTLTVNGGTSITPAASGVGVWSGGTLSGSTTPALGAATATSINGSTVSPGHYTGEPSTGSASSGEIGEYVFSNIQNASAVSLTSGVTANVASISLTAGDWDVWIQPMFQGGATTNSTFLDAGITLVSATLPVLDGLNATQWAGGSGTVLGAGVFCIPNLRTRFSLSGTFTVFFVAQATFTVSTMKAFGSIQARRAR